jgi:ribosomal protein L40E
MPKLISDKDQRSKKRLRKTDACPKCGGEKTISAFVCRKCSYNRGRDESRYTCPVCGGEKSFVSKTCINCRQPPKSTSTKGIPEKSEPRTPSLSKTIPPEWLYGFVGFFMGEGYVSLHKSSANTVVASIGIKLRRDDEAVLKEAVSFLGGHINYLPARGNASPGVVWEISRFNQLVEIVPIFLKHCSLHAKKRQDLELLQRFITWRSQQPYRGLDWTHAFELIEELRDIRDFKLQG